MSTSTILSLDEFESSSIGTFDPGTWIVEYHDRTHLPKNTYVSLGKVEIEFHPQREDKFFRFRPQINQ